MLSYPNISSLVGQDSVDEKLKGQRDHHVTVARVVQHVTCAHVMSENMYALIRQPFTAGERSEDG